MNFIFLKFFLGEIMSFAFYQKKFYTVSTNKWTLDYEKFKPEIYMLDIGN